MLIVLFGAVYVDCSVQSMFRKAQSMLIVPLRIVYFHWSVPRNLLTLSYFGAGTLHHVRCQLHVYPSLLYFCEMYDTNVFVHVLGGGVLSMFAEDCIITLLR